MKLDSDEKDSLTEHADDLISRSRRFKCEKIKGICGRCQHSHIIKLAHMNDPIITCTYLSRTVPTNVEECNKFAQIGRVSVWKLAEMAHLIDNREGYKGDYR